MKRGIIFSSFILFLLLLLGSGFFYNIIRTPLLDQYEKAEIYANKVLHDIHDVQYYYGTDAFYVVDGIDENNNEVIMWINDTFDSHIVRKKEEGIAKDDALSIFEREVGDATITAIRLGVEKNTPIYEITYETAEKNYGYYYITFDEGMFLKRYQLRGD